MDGWTKELDEWAKRQATLTENYERECVELAKPRTCEAMRKLTDALLAVRLAARSEAKYA